MRVEKDFEGLLELFNKYRVKYCIVGAFAVGFYGYPRYTKDMDVLVGSSLKNGERIAKALSEFGFSCLNLSAKDFSQKGVIIQLGYEPVRVDLVTSIKGCNFAQVWAKRKIGRYGKEKVFFIGLKELIKNKRIADRRQDRIDLERLLARLKKGNLGFRG